MRSTAAAGLAITLTLFQSAEADELLYLPVRLHVLEAEELPAIHCELSDADLARRIAGVNRIWAQAGIRVYVESIVREPAANRGRFRLALPAADDPLGLYQILTPRDSRAADALDVYFVKELPVNGVYFGRPRIVYVKESPRLAAVEGGTDYPPERVLSHEIGHFLGLGHVDDRSLLMARGTTGFGISAEEIRGARAVAGRMPAVLSAERLLEKAAADLRAGRRRSARIRLQALAETPGDSPAKARAIEKLRDLIRRF